MRILRVLALTGLLTASLGASTLIQYDLTALGGNAYRYTYHTNGLNLLVNYELDILFDAALYGSLSNGVTPAGFDLLLLQPNQPVGAQGVFNALALVDQPSALSFSVDFTFLGAGSPGPQEFAVFDDRVRPNIMVVPNTSTQLAVSGVPEPATLWLCAGAIIIFIRGEYRRCLDKGGIPPQGNIAAPATLL